MFMGIHSFVALLQHQCLWILFQILFCVPGAAAARVYLRPSSIQFGANQIILSPMAFPAIRPDVRCNAAD